MRVAERDARIDQRARREVWAGLLARIFKGENRQQRVRRVGCQGDVEEVRPRVVVWPITRSPVEGVYWVVYLSVSDRVYADRGGEGGGIQTLPPLYSTHIEFFLRSVVSCPATVGMRSFGGMRRRPGPSRRARSLCVGIAAGSIGSPGSTVRFPGAMTESEVANREAVVVARRKGCRFPICSISRHVRGRYLALSRNPPSYVRSLR